METPTTDRLLGNPEGHLALRVRTPPYAGHVVCLRSTKCSIGSARSSTLRLRAVGIDPCHLVVYRSPHGMFVQRWSRQTCLNGRSFDVEPLGPGDRLSVGFIEFEVLPESSPAMTRATDAALAATDGQLVDQLEALRAELVECQRQLHAANSRRADLEQFLSAGRETTREHRRLHELESDNCRLEACLAALRAERAQQEEAAHQTIRLLRSERDHLAHRLRNAGTASHGTPAAPQLPGAKDAASGGESVESYLDHLMKRVTGPGSASEDPR